MTEGTVNEPGFSLRSDTKNLGINCVEPAKMTLSLITANSEGGNPNKVKMGNNLVADFYLNDTLNNNIVLEQKINANIPLHAILRKNVQSTGTITSGNYTGSSIIRIKFD